MWGLGICSIRSDINRPMNDAGSDAGECECGEFERNTGTDAGKHAGKLQV